jgi:hypothetical protein
MSEKPLAEYAMEEVIEATRDFSRGMDKLKKSERGSDRYYGLLCGDLYVLAEVVRLKAAGAKQESNRLSNQRDRIERKENAQKRMKRKKNRPAVLHRSRPISDQARRRVS